MPFESFLVLPVGEVLGDGDVVVIFVEQVGTMPGAPSCGPTRRWSAFFATAGSNGSSSTSTATRRCGSRGLRASDQRTISKGVESVRGS